MKDLKFICVLMLCAILPGLLTGGCKNCNLHRNQWTSTVAEIGPCDEDGYCKVKDIEGRFSILQLPWKGETRLFTETYDDNRIRERKCKGEE